MEAAPRRRLELAEELPASLPDTLRRHARHLVLGRVVEFRLLAEGASEERFLRELGEMGALDHRAFLPVLERGRFRGAPYYAVPLRGGVPLVQVMEAGTWEAPERWEVLRELALAMAVAHASGVAAVALDPRRILLEEEAGRVWFQHHRGEEGEATTPVEAVRAWGKLASEVLEGARGEAVAPAVRVVLEACVQADPGRRPANMGEVMALLRALPSALAQGPPERAPSLGGAEDVLHSVRDLREAGVVPDLGASPRLEVPDLGPEPWLDRFGAWVEDLLARPAGRIGFAALIVALVLAPPLLLRWGGAPGPPPRPSMGSPQADPYLLALTRMEAETPEDVDEILRLLQALRAQERLPEDFDPARVEELAAARREQVGRATELAREILASLRRVVEERGGP